MGLFKPSTTTGSGNDPAEPPNIRTSLWKFRLGLRRLSIMRTRINGRRAEAWFGATFTTRMGRR